MEVLRVAVVVDMGAPCFVRCHDEEAWPSGGAMAVTRLLGSLVLVAVRGACAHLVGLPGFTG